MKIDQKICHINLARGFRGGEKQTYLLIRELADKTKQTVITRKLSKLSTIVKSIPGVDVIEIEKPFIRNVNKLKPFSLIHAHEAKAAHMAFFSHLMYQTPYIVTRRVIKKPKNKFFFKKVHSTSSTVVAISNQIKKNLEALEADICTQVISSSFSKLAVDTSRADQLKKKYTDKFLIGHVGALVNKDKGQIHIINVAKAIVDEYPDIHFLFLGDGIDKDRFLTHAGGCENIEFGGFKDNIGVYYSIFDLFLFPSLDEGLGSAVLDAFYFGLPVIATEVGGIPDMIKHRKTGILIQPRDEQAMFDQIVSLYQNAALRRQLGNNGRHSLARFDIKYTSNQYLELYHHILNP